MTKKFNMPRARVHTVALRVALSRWCALGAMTVLLAAGAGQTITAQTASGRQFYAAPGGLPTNDGSKDRPLNLAKALLTTGPVRPGDTLWLRGGRYVGNFTSYLAGTAAAPIIVRQYPGERATIDANTPNRALPALTVMGSDTWYWGFEVTDTNPARINSGGFNNPVLRQTSVDVFGPRTRFINLIVHDGQMGYGLWTPAVDAEIYGNLIYNVGVEAPDRGHGHSVYVQNQTGTKRIVDNIMFNGFSFGIHAYTSGGRIDNLHMEGNTLFNHGVLSAASGAKANIIAGGGDVADFPRVLNNYTYYADNGDGRGADLSYGNGCATPELRDNYMVAGDPVVVHKCTNVTMTGNTWYGRTGTLATQFPNNVFLSSRPTGVRTFVRPNAYERGRAHITVFNWNLLPTVRVDVAAAGLRQGEAFEIRDAQNFYGTPIVTGVYWGTPVDIPMTDLTVVRPIGTVPLVPEHTAPEFGAFVLLPGGGDDATPAQSITAVQPQSGPASGGTLVTISGTGFASGAAVTVGGKAAVAVSVIDATTIQATTPPGAAGTVEVSVTLAGQTVTKLSAFTYALPTITSVSPAVGPTAGGTTVSIRGTSFAPGATVTIGGKPVTNVVVVNAGLLTAATPAHSAGVHDVSVTSLGLTVTLRSAFTYGAVPTITSISPLSGPMSGGTRVTVYGTQFAAGMTAVFGGKPGTSVSVISPTQLLVTTPVNGAGLVDLTVGVGTQAATRTKAFNYVPPVVGSVSPTSGSLAGGTKVTISGRYFESGSTVSFGGIVAATVTFVSSTTMTAVAPVGKPGAVDVTVHVNGYAAVKPLAYTYRAPVIGSLSPTRGPVGGGTLTYIYGANFAPGAAVKFGATAASNVKVVSAGLISANAPSSLTAGLVGVTVTVAGHDTTRPASFTYLRPIVTSVAPARGSVAGGTTVVIYGQNFSTGATVLIGGKAASHVTLVNAGTIRAVTPAGISGSADVTVSINGQAATRSAAFAYLLPVISSLGPASGTTRGGTTVTIYGANFGPGASVRFGGIAATDVRVFGHTRIVAVTPARAAGPAHVTVTVNGQSVTRANAFSYIP